MITTIVPANLTIQYKILFEYTYIQYLCTDTGYKYINSIFPGVGTVPTYEYRESTYLYSNTLMSTGTCKLFEYYCRYKFSRHFEYLSFRQVFETVGVCSFKYVCSYSYVNRFIQHWMWSFIYEINYWYIISKWNLNTHTHTHTHTHTTAVK